MYVDTPIAVIRGLYTHSDFHTAVVVHLISETLSTERLDSSWVFKDADNRTGERDGRRRRRLVQTGLPHSDEGNRQSAALFSIGRSRTETTLPGRHPSTLVIPR